MIKLLNDAIEIFNPRDRNIKAVLKGSFINTVKKPQKLDPSLEYDCIIDFNLRVINVIGVNDDRNNK